MRGEASYNETTRNPDITKSEDIDSGCTQAQITCTHTDDTQTKQNTGNST